MPFQLAPTTPPIGLAEKRPHLETRPSRDGLKPRDGADDVEFHAFILSETSRRRKSSKRWLARSPALRSDSAANPDAALGNNPEGSCDRLLLKEPYEARHKGEDRVDALVTGSQNYDAVIVRGQIAPNVSESPSLQMVARRGSRAPPSSSSRAVVTSCPATRSRAAADRGRFSSVLSLTATLKLSCGRGQAGKA